MQEEIAAQKEDLKKHDQGESETKQQEKIKQQKLQLAKIPMKVRNRRFKRLKELREQGFFSEEVIKLRHPLLYHLFVGQYDFVQQSSLQTGANLFSSFLQKHLLNMQYRSLLSEEMSKEVEKILQKENTVNQEQIKQLKRISCVKNNIMENNQENEEQLEMKLYKDKDVNGEQNKQKDNEMDVQLSNLERTTKMSGQLKTHNPSQTQIQTLRQNISPPRKYNHNHNSHLINSVGDPSKTEQIYSQIQNQTRLTQEERSLQQQSLIEYCQELFLQGKLINLPEINYTQIDENNDYDDQKEEDNDLQDKYFDEVQDQIQQEAENYYTGIQDY